MQKYCFFFLLYVFKFFLTHFYFFTKKRAIFQVANTHISRIESCAEKAVLTKVLSLYGANLLIRHIGSMYEVIKIKA